MFKISLPATFLLSITLTHAALANTDTQHDIQQLQQSLKRQQARLNQQAAQIRRLSHQPSDQQKSAVNVNYSSTAIADLPVLSRATLTPNTALVPTPTLIINNNDFKFTLNGFVNTLIMNASDGKANNTLFGFNQPRSRITLGLSKQLNPDITVGIKNQFGFNINQTNQLSQTNASPGQSIDTRVIELYATSKKLGKLSLGKGPTATDNIAYTDFSGTKMLGIATLEDIGGGLFYRQRSNNQLSSVTVSNTVNGLDGFSRRVRVRYDSPSFHGLMLATSASEGNRQDIALKYGHKLGHTLVAAQASLTSPQTLSSGANEAHGNVVNASAGVLFNNGINLSASWADLLASGSRDNPYYYYIKPGYQHRFFHTGITALSADMGRYYNMAQNDDEATSYGAQLAQSIDAVHTVVYTGYRYFHLKRTATAFKSLNLILLGAFVKF